MVQRVFALLTHADVKTFRIPVLPLPAVERKSPQFNASTAPVVVLPDHQAAVPIAVAVWIVFSRFTNGVGAVNIVPHPFVGGVAMGRLVGVATKVPLTCAVGENPNVTGIEARGEYV